MKGLLLKDFYLTKRYFKLYFALCLFLIIVSFWSDSIFLLMLYPCLIAGALPYTLWGLDENSRWEDYQKILPNSIEKIVSCKYVMGLLGQFLIVGLLLLVQLLKVFLSEAGNGKTVWTMMAYVLGSALLMAGLTMPFVVYFGAQKGRFMCAMVIGIFYAGVFLLNSQYSLEDVRSLSTISFCIVSLVVYAASWFVSIALYKKKCRK